MDEQHSTPDEAPFDDASAVDEPDAAQEPEAGADTGATTASGRIVLAATPIGNVGDASSRLIELLATSDIVAAEDTRRLHRLVQGLGRGGVRARHQLSRTQRGSQDR
ncbi:hypothetical protein StoSoilB13_36220 (plasmid) [Arthrobacter sp. StoSoilB13]|nr:hypothetical protein StoSoilB13_36220 [Arthrobacter sp. StoSoilB13]